MGYARVFLVPCVFSFVLAYFCSVNTLNMSAAGLMMRMESEAALLTDKDRNIRRDAADALGEMGEQA